MKSKFLQELLAKGIELLSEYESRSILQEYGIPCPKEVMVGYREGKRGAEYLSELKKMDEWPGYPLFFKVVSRDIKSATDANAIRRATSDIEAASLIDTIINNAKKYKEEINIEGILASEDVSTHETREMLIGSTVNEQFGHIISLGFGGVYVEVYKDVEFRVTPIKEMDVHNMIKHLRGRALLGAFRTARPVDMRLLVDTVLKVSKMVEENPEIVELDINPLIVGPDRAVAVDTLVRIQAK